VQLDQNASVRPQPLASAPELAELAKGTTSDRLGTFGNFTKVTLDGQRFASSRPRN